MTPDRLAQLEHASQRANTGDREAASAVITAHLPYWMSAARGILNSSGTDAADLVQDAITRLLVLWEAGEGPATNTRAYVTTMMRNAHRDQLRAPRSREQSLDELEEVSGQPAAHSVDDHRELELAREFASIRRAFRTLSDDHQSVLRATVLDGRKPAELVTELGRPAPAISNLIARAKQALHRAVLIDHLAEGGPECAENAEQLPPRIHADLDAHTDTDRGIAHVRSCRRCQRHWRRFAAVSSTLGILPLLTIAQWHTGAAPASASGSDAGATDAAPGSDAAGSADSPSAASATPPVAAALAGGAAGGASAAAGTGAAAAASAAAAVSTAAGVAGAGAAGAAAASAAGAGSSAGASTGAAGAASAAAGSATRTAGRVIRALSSTTALVAGVALVAAAAGAFVIHTVVSNQEAPEHVYTGQITGDNPHGAAFDVQLGVDGSGALHTISVQFDVQKAEAWELAAVQLTLPANVSLQDASNALECSGTTAVSCVPTAATSLGSPFVFGVTSTAPHGTVTLSLSAVTADDDFAGTATGRW